MALGADDEEATGVQHGLLAHGALFFVARDGLLVGGALLGADLAGCRGIAFECTVTDAAAALGHGGSHAHGVGHGAPHEWRRVHGLQLPRATLLWAERVTERTRSASLRDSLHVWDAAWIAGDDVRRLPYSERHRRLEVLVAALARDADIVRQGVLNPEVTGIAPDPNVYDEEPEEAAQAAVNQVIAVRAKRPFALRELRELFGEAERREKEASLPPAPILLAHMSHLPIITMCSADEISR